MRSLLFVLLAAVCASADESEDRRSKLPYIADAVGNTLPPPSGGPATVGSPVNLLTPDRYEFYTFDESGELVKRLMTLEEIQAIVAAGEETEGLVTFANENQPTIAFNFSQPPYNKVHSVVTNVQNVLKAQMEAHKNKPQVQPTLDTPDVSDSWSLILPSIFGNTGVDIVPDKSSSTFTTPETETIELIHTIDDNSLSKEGSNQIISTSTNLYDELKVNEVSEKLSMASSKTEPVSTTSTTSTMTTTTAKPVTTSTTTIKTPANTTKKYFSTTSRTPSTTSTVKTSTSANKPTTTTSKPTTAKRVATTTTTTIRPRTSSTSKPRTTTTTTKSTTKVIKQQSTPKPTTIKPTTTTRNATISISYNDGNYTRVQTFTNTASTTDKTTVNIGKLTTFVPVSTAAYVTERSPSTKAPFVSSTTKRTIISTSRAPVSSTKSSVLINTYKTSPSTSEYLTSSKSETEKYNATTVTTQSVSPSTTVSSTEFISVAHEMGTTEKIPVSANENKNHSIKTNEQEHPLFDISQSISQIASDLGGNYRPLPTSADLLDSTKYSDVNIESKENIEIEIPSESDKESEVKNPEASGIQFDSYIKISTLEPSSQNKSTVTLNDSSKQNESKTTEATVITKEVPPPLTTTTTIDPVLSESMGDLISQVVNEAPQKILEDAKETNKDNKLSSMESSKLTTEVKDPENFITSSIKPIQIERIVVKPSNTEVNNATNENKQNKTVEKPVLKPENITVSIKKPDNNKNISAEKVSLNNDEKQIKNITESIQNIKTTQKVTTTTLKTILKEAADKIENLSNKSKESVTSHGDSSNLSPTTRVTTTTTTTKNPQENSVTKKPSTLKKPEASSNANKIVQTNSEKINNIKEAEKTPLEQSLPKIEEFKKKIQKVNIDDKEFANDRNNSWKLISTVSPPKSNEILKDKHKTENQESTSDKNIVLDFSKENQGLEVTTKNLNRDISEFTELCNELAFRYWQTITDTIDKKRSFVLSPYSITSMLAMMFMGARGATSGEMNEILKLDDMVTFNPHFTLKNISDSIETSPASGVIVSAFVRELFTDRTKGKVLTFYKERAQHFYNGHVEEINFKLISDIIRRRTNLLVKRYTWGKIVEYMKANTITMHPPLAAFSANIFETDCSGSSVEGRDGEMYFVVSPNVRQRRLVPVPAVVYRTGFLAGYDPVLDATAAALGNTNSIISTLFLMPGQQGNVVHADDLEELEKRLLNSNPTTPSWNRLLRTLLPRMGLELQIPRFSHKSLFNVSTTLKKMGLKELFNPDHADLGGLNGPSKDLYLSDMVQSTTFVTCGEGVIGEQHHIEEYPEDLLGPQRRRTSRWAVSWDEPRDYQRAFHDPHDVGDAMHLPLHLRPRQARLPARTAQPARLKFDRPFLFFVRHNPSGMILYVGRYNPRLLP